MCVFINFTLQTYLYVFNMIVSEDSPKFLYRHLSCLLHYPDDVSDFPCSVPGECPPHFSTMTSVKMTGMINGSSHPTTPP